MPFNQHIAHRTAGPCLGDRGLPCLQMHGHGRQRHVRMLYLAARPHSAFLIRPGKCTPSRGLRGFPSSFVQGRRRSAQWLGLRCDFCGQVCVRLSHAHAEDGV